MKFIYLYTNDTTVDAMDCYNYLSQGLHNMGHTVTGLKIDSITKYSYILERMRYISNYDCVLVRGWPQSLIRYLKQRDIPRLVIYDPPIRPINNSRNFNGYYGLCWGQPHKYFYYEDSFDNSRWDRMSKSMGIKLGEWHVNNSGKILIGVRRELTFEGCNKRNMDQLINTCASVSNNIALCSRTRSSRRLDMKDWPKFKSKMVLKTIKRFNTAKCLITTGGTMVPKSIIAGVPCYYSDRTIADPLSITKDLKKFLSKPEMPDRTKWLNWVAYQQWTCKEIELGSAFDYMFHVKGKVYDF